MIGRWQIDNKLWDKDIMYIGDYANTHFSLKSYILAGMNQTINIQFILSNSNKCNGESR